MVVVLPARDEASRVHRRTGKVTRRLLDTWRVEQPQAVSERLVLYGEKWRGQLGDDHSTIRRDLQTAHIRKPCHAAEFSASVVLAGPASPTPSYSPPNSPEGACATAGATSAADETSCGDNWRHQLAAEALVNMAWTAAGRQGTVQQQSLRTADQQQSAAPWIAQPRLARSPTRSPTRSLLASLARSPTRSPARSLLASPCLSHTARR